MKGLESLLTEQGRICRIYSRKRKQGDEGFERLLKVQRVKGAKYSRKRKEDGRDFESLFIEQGLIVKLSGF
jgi:hypothetical protein